MHAPGIQRYTRCSFYTLGDVLYTIGGFYTDKLYSQSKHRSKKVTHTPETQFTPQRLNSCSLDTLISLVFLNEEELSYKAAQQQGLSGQADTVCTSC